MFWKTSAELPLQIQHIKKQAADKVDRKSGKIPYGFGPANPRVGGGSYKIFAPNLTLPHRWENKTYGMPKTRTRPTHQISMLWCINQGIYSTHPTHLNQLLKYMVVNHSFID